MKGWAIKSQWTVQEFIQPWSGQAVRHIPQGPHDVYDFSRAGLAADNRWNSQGDPTLYLARDRGVALAEWARHLREERSPLLAQYAKKRTVYRFRVELQHTLDLRTHRRAPPTGYPPVPAIASAYECGYRGRKRSTVTARAGSA